MKALAEIVAISNEVRTVSNNDGTEYSRVIVSFQIGADILHHTFFKKTANLERYPWSSDGIVKGAIGELNYDISSEIAYSQKDNSPYVKYNMKNVRFIPKVVSQAQPVHQPTEQHEVAAAMAEAVEQIALNPETGLPF